jgi:hypothetical protein
MRLALISSFSAPAFLIAVLVRYGRLTRSQLPQLTDLLTRLLAQRRFPEAIHLLDKHVDFLIATHSKAPFLIRLRKRLAPRRLEDLIALVQGPNGTVLQRNDLFWDPISRLADRVLPTESRAQNVASNLIRRVWTNEALVAHLASATTGP